MSTFYKLAYTVGFTPWERANQSPAEAQRFEQMIARDEAERGGPGRALDLGCGTGFWTVTLARRGWQVTGVDVIDKALARARKRVARSGVHADVVRADVTELPVDTVGTGFDLFLDLGCFHGLGAKERTAMARVVTARSNPDAILRMFAFGKPLGPKFMPQGATRADIAAAYAGWEITDVLHVENANGPALPGQKSEPTLYQLRRRA